MSLQEACGPHAMCDFGVCKDSEVPVGQACEVGPKGEDVGRCTDDAYCANSDGSFGGNMQTCLARASLGEACTRYQPGTPCQMGDACEGGTCVPDLPRKLGESCDQAACETGLYCDGQTCQKPTLKKGDACGLSNGEFLPGDCVPGLKCGNLDYPDGGGATAPETCVSLPKQGETCLHSECAAGLLCDRPVLADGSSGLPFCTKPHAEGEACGFNDNGKASLCEVGLECRAHFCRAACQ